MPTSILSPNTLIAFQVLCCTRVEAFRSTLRRYNLCNPVCSILSLLMLFKETVAAGERRWVKECSIYRLVGPHITRLLCRWQILKRIFFIKFNSHFTSLIIALSVIPSVYHTLATDRYLQQAQSTPDPNSPICSVSAACSMWLLFLLWKIKIFKSWRMVRVREHWRRQDTFLQRAEAMALDSGFKIYHHHIVFTA